MPNLENPSTFRSIVQSSTSLDGKAKDVEDSVASVPISDWFNPVFPLPEKPAEAKKTLVNLTLAVGEVKEFTEAEAKFLKGKYTWLKETSKPVKAGEPVVKAEVKARPSQNIEINDNLD